MYKRQFLGGNALNWIKNSKEFLIKNDNNGLSNLIEFVYRSSLERYRDESYFQDHCVLAPLYTNVDELDSSILAMLHSNNSTYMSFDAFLGTNIDFVNDYINLPKMLHDMNFSGFLNHVIQLKVGAPNNGVI